MTVAEWQEVGGAVTGYVGHVFTSGFSFPSSPFPLPSSGWEEGGLLSRNTEGWRNDGAGPGGGNLTEKLCLVIFNSWDTTWLMVFLDALATFKPRTGLVSDHPNSTKKE